MCDQHPEQNAAQAGHAPMQNERSHLGKPQLFVQLSFGLSWTDRHIPQSHHFSYTSKKLKSARDSGHFPRQIPPTDHQYGHQRRHQEYVEWRNTDERHRSDPEHPRGRPGKSRFHPFGSQRPPTEPQTVARQVPTASERRRSAPPPSPGVRWRDNEEEPSATRFPRPARAIVKAPTLWKDLPMDPSGEGLPSSVSAWPFETDNDDQNEPPFANLPTVVPLSPVDRWRTEDPQRVRELTSLSTAMMTVDNGFENQWWYQGERQSVDFTIPSSQDDDIRPMSMADAAVLSAAEPPSVAETFCPDGEGLGGLVSPVSGLRPDFSSPRPFKRPSTSGSNEELWLSRERRAV
ncbi:hypothetical protein GGS20DRAFT_573726 [Poronia punctata]|nr:hypothetical protein GGS20DRAFT_573726 [Poronia punctata]